MHDPKPPTPTHTGTPSLAARPQGHRHGPESLSVISEAARRGVISGEAQVEHAGVRCRLPLWLVVEEESQHVHQAQQAASDASGAADPQEIVQDINAQRAQGLVRGRRRGRGGQAQAVFELLGRQGREPRALPDHALCRGAPGPPQLPADEDSGPVADAAELWTGEPMDYELSERPGASHGE